MMQPCASAAKLRGGGPILRVGTEAMSIAGTPPPRTVIGDPSRTCGRYRDCLAPSPPHCAGRRVTSGGTTPSRTSRHKAITSLRAKAGCVLLRLPLAASVRSRYQRANSLSVWNLRAMRTGSCRAARGRYPNGIDPSRAAGRRSRRVSRSDRHTAPPPCDRACRATTASCTNISAVSMPTPILRTTSAPWRLAPWWVPPPGAQGVRARSGGSGRQRTADAPYLV